MKLYDEAKATRYKKLLYKRRSENQVNEGNNIGTYKAGLLVRVSDLPAQAYKLP